MEFMWGGGSRGRDAMREGDHEGRGEGVCTQISETQVQLGYSVSGGARAVTVIVL